MDEKVIRMGELFSGPGGIAYGADLAFQSSKGYSNYRLVHVWATDYDSSACATYKRNIDIDPDCVYCEDVKTLDLDKLSQIDGFAFGFPCNDFSVVGERKGSEGKFGMLYTYGVEVLKKFQPEWFVAENVSGLENSKDGCDFRTILNDLFNCGYDLFPNMYKFEEYGVPQSRHRIIVVGLRKDLGLQFKIPAPNYKIKTVREALESPPIPVDAFNNEYTKQSKKVVERLKYIRPGENAFTAEMPDHLKLHVKGATLSQIYRRVDPNKPSYTITGSGGGGTHGYHWSEDRAFTNRERARIQTFPDSFVFEGSKEAVRRQIGMAVPPAGVKIIFESLIKTLSGLEYEYVKPSFEPMIHDRPPL